MSGTGILLAKVRKLGAVGLAISKVHCTFDRNTNFCAIIFVPLEDP